MSFLARGLSALVVMIFVFTAAEADAAPKSKLIKRWYDHDMSSNTVIDHSAWDSFLKVYVRDGSDGINRVAYGTVSAADKAALDAYIAGLSATEIGAHNRNEQFVYWVNLYNAVTVQLILEHYPVKTIKKVKGGLFNSGPWDEVAVTVNGVGLTLNNIEHGILRPIWKDPRIHYVVNCASIGCPNLYAAAFTSGNADKMLTAAAKDYVNHPRGVSVEGGRLVVSSIYEWYQEDFGGSDAGVIDHVKKYARPELKEMLAGISKVYDDRYDWTLNGVM